MTFRHRHLRAPALLVLSVVTATAGLGALRSCWGAEHLHAGMAEPECAMHHGAAPAVEGHGHHHHDAPQASAAADQQMSCKCANDVSTPLTMPPAVVVECTPHFASAPGALVVPSAPQRIPDFDTIPLSPPPRPPLS